MNLQVRNLRKRYGSVEALSGVDLTVESGMFGLLGPNGAGKTTLLRILVGLIQPTGGTVVIGGEDVTREPGKTRVRRVLGYLPQDVGFYPDLTAVQFLDYIGTLKEMDDAVVRRRRVNEVLEIVGLQDAARRRLGGYSGGMKRRVGIAQALLADPQVPVVDEPTAGLDPEERVRFRNLLADLAGNRLVLLSTHIVEDVSQTCRELALLHHGRIHFRGTAWWPGSWRSKGRRRSLPAWRTPTCGSCRRSAIWPRPRPPACRRPTREDRPQRDGPLPFWG